MASTALITGISGQDGAYLAAHLLEQGWIVHGTSRQVPLADPWRLVELGIAEAVTLHPLDASRADYADQLAALLDRLAPDAVYNLAALSSVGQSFADPLAAGQAAGFAVTALLEAIRQSGGKPAIFQASSSEIFAPQAALPLSESSPCAPTSPYGAAKLYAHHMARLYRDAWGLPVSTGILFNHESPLRGAGFVTRKITLGLARIKVGLADTLALGNLAVRRDWGYAPDYVVAMVRMLARPADDYVLATGESHALTDFVTQAAAALGFSLVWDGVGRDSHARDRISGRVLVTVDPALYRPADTADLRGDPGKAETRLGWRRSLSFPALVERLAACDYDRVRAGA